MTTRPSILIADDDDDDRLFLQNAFDHHNFHDLAMFEDGTQVLKYLETTSVLPQMIVSDFNMPVLTGLEPIN
ncbi:response regulator [Segetibacter aerophilus]|nr:response regulator [Segetibacter aerophilus]